MERSKNALKNIITGFISKIVIMLLAFATKTVFIRILGAEFTGISSLYTNILSVLSLAELGISNVLMFYLYSALKKADKNEICQLVSEFKSIYRKIIVFILGIGILLIPFLRIIINSELDYYSLIIYYLLYLINSVASYFVIYRTMVISADQKSYITNVCSTVTTIVAYVLQFIYLLIFRNFIGYLIIQVGCTIINNLIQNYIACKKYPFLRNKVEKREKVIKGKELFKNIKATFMYKIAETILGQTDSIIISVLFGTVFVGYYSNYYTMILYMINIASIIATGLVAGFGNLNAENNEERMYEMFRSAMLIFSFFGVFTISCYACVIQDVIPIWIGKEYLISYDIVIALLLNYYITISTNAMWMYRSAMGLFKEVQYINLIAALLNIILSVLLGKLIGIAGVIVATTISKLLSSFWYEGMVLFKKFGKSPWIYYRNQFKDFVVSVGIVAVCYYISSFIQIENIIIQIIFKIIICIVIAGGIELLVHFKTTEFKIIKNKIFNSIKK